MPESIHIGPDGTRYQFVATMTTTPSSDTSPKPVTVKFKTFWKTTRQWAQADVHDFQKQAPAIAERLRSLRYWDKHGDLRYNKFTCEDFAIRVLCEYAAPRGLPVKLTTGVRTYRNVEIYNAEMHGRFSSDLYGFSEMVMLSFGAADMQRTGSNTVSVAGPEALLPGDILAKANDNSN